MAKKKVLKDVTEIAAELLEVRLQKAELTTKDKLLSDALKKHPDFKKQDYFEYVDAVSVVIADKDKAISWAQTNAPHLLTVDTKGARQLFERDMNIAEGFESKITKRLVQKGAENDRGYDIG